MASSNRSAFPLIVGVLAIFAIAGVGGYFAFRSPPPPVTTKERPDGSVEDDHDYPGETYVGDPPIKTPSGLLYYDLKKGDGPQPKGPSSNVRVHSTGRLRDGTKFDSSYDRVQPFETKLSEVIAGWTEGVGSMKVGGKRKLVIPYKLGYGDAGSPPKIPGKSTLIFDIELISVMD